MGFYALIGILALLVTVALWMAPRKSGSKSRRQRGSVAARHVPVGQPSAKGANSAALPDVHSDAPAEFVDDAQTLPEELADLRLILDAGIDDEVSRRIDAICNQIPEPHPIQKLLASGLDTPDDLMAAVASDAGLTANVLRTVNSAAFRLASPITSVQQAVIYLGVSVAKGLVAQSAVALQTQEGTPEQQTALSRIWKSACTASALAQMLAQELGIARPSVLATRALFSNLGDVALVLKIDAAPAWYNDEMDIVQRLHAQQSVCSANTAMIGARLARLWALPDDIANAIETGLIPLVTPPAEHPMEGDARRANVLVYLAGRIGDRVAYRELRDIGELELVDSREPGLFHLAGHLKAAGLVKVPDLFQEPTFRRKVNRVLATLSA